MGRTNLAAFHVPRIQVLSQEQVIGALVECPDPSAPCDSEGIIAASNNNQTNQLFLRQVSLPGQGWGRRVLSRALAACGLGQEW